MNTTASAAAFHATATRRENARKTVAALTEKARTSGLSRLELTRLSNARRTATR